jgi:hypothetical protein
VFLLLVGFSCAGAILACVVDVPIGANATSAPDAANDSGPGLDADAGSATDSRHDSGSDSEASNPLGDACTDGSCSGSTCTPQNPVGICPMGLICEMGQCISMQTACSPQAPNGSCPMGLVCQMGQCASAPMCVPAAPDSGCSVGELCAPQGVCQFNPCVMSPCGESLCCPTLGGQMTYMAVCTMAMQCP